jgi:hypothetical protein
LPLAERTQVSLAADEGPQDMKIGITGHQERPGIDWQWVRASIARELARSPKPIVGYSSLARGSDQLFAEQVLEKGGLVCAVIPMTGYERFFDVEGLERYRRLRAKCEVVVLEKRGSDQQSFFDAGKYIVDQADRMYAVWDGETAAGFGGTADIVKYALEKGLPTTRFDPVAQQVEELEP